MKNFCLKILCSIFLLVLANSSFSQSLNKTEREYFILGTLGDYMGRIIDPQDGDLFDRYYAHEGPLISFTDSLLKIDYSPSSYKIERYIDTAGNPLSFKIFSGELKDKFNSYYKFKTNVISDMNGKPELEGELKDSIFKTDQEKLAFLAGVYVRFGRTNDTAYEISIANSPSKARVCYQLLTDLKSKPFYQIWHDYIPAGHHVYFHPDKSVKKYLQNYIYLHKLLDDSYKQTFQKILSEDRMRKKRK